jgi:hypothetical protein
MVFHFLHSVISILQKLEVNRCIDDEATAYDIVSMLLVYTLLLLNEHNTYNQTSINSKTF